MCALIASFLVVALFVIGNDGFEKIAEPFVAAGFVFAGDLQQQPFELVETAQSVARDGVGEAGAQHDELVLAFVFRGAGGAAHGVIKAAQLAARAGIHIAHAADDDVGLVVEVEAVGDQLVEIDLGRTVEAAVTAGAVAAGDAPVATAIAAGVHRGRSPPAVHHRYLGATVLPGPGGRSSRGWSDCSLAVRPCSSAIVYPTARFSHVGIRILIFCQSRPFERDQTFGPQLQPPSQIAAGHFFHEVRAELSEIRVRGGWPRGRSGAGTGVRAPAAVSLSAGSAGSLGRFYLLIQVAKLGEELPAAAELFVQLNNGFFQIGRVVQLLPFEDAAEDVEAIFVGWRGRFRGRGRSLHRVRASGAPGSAMVSAMVMVLASAPGSSFRFSCGEDGEDALQFAGEAGQGIP